MKITIDTKEESKEEIKKLISFLQKLVDEDSYSSSSSPEPAAGAFNMFSDNDSEGSSSYTNIFGENKPEEKEETFNVRDMLEKY
jgi:hypothetical protein